MARSGNPFPANLDRIWHLVYDTKGSAVASLRSTFEQHVDYQFFKMSPKNSKGRGSEVYHLTVPCLEWLVARKVREIFEVYREVFHRVANQVNQFTEQQESALVSLVNDLTEKVIGLEGKIRRMHKAQEEYLKATVIDRQEIKEHKERQADEARKMRDAAMEVLSSTVNVKYESMSWDSRWSDVWWTLERDYCINITKLTRYQGEHLIDVAMRNGLIEKVYEIIRFKIAKWVQ